LIYQTMLKEYTSYS